jgi:hypothetical protein
MAEWHAAAGHRVVRTVTEDNGDVVDLVAAESVPGSQGSPPPPQTDANALALDYKEFPLRTGAGDPSVVRFVRPRFEHYASGRSHSRSFAQYLTELPEGVPPAGLAPGTPCTTDCLRLYAASRHNVSNIGVFSNVNAYWGPGEIESNTFFVAQTNVSDLSVNIKTSAEWIGWIIGRIPALSDTAARLYTEFFTAGTDNTGPYIGGWAGPGGSAGFVPLAGAWIALGDPAPNNFSTVGGSQYAIQIYITYFSSAAWNCGSGCTGSWWLGLGGGWVGHYKVGAANPNINFDRITSSAPTAEWYGEVYDPSPGSWTVTDMGSPQKASSTSTYGQSAWFADLGFRRAADNVPLNSTGAQVANAGGDDANCYTRYEETTTDPNWDTVMWFGGPGRTSTNGCDPF